MIKKIALENFYLLIKSFLKNLKMIEIKTAAAMLAYFLIFSIFPFFIVLLNIVSFFFKGKEVDIINFFEKVPEEIGQTITSVLVSLINSSSSALLSISIIIALWSGSNGIVQLINKVNEAFGHEPSRSFFKKRLLGIAFTIGLVALIILVLASGVFNNLILDLLLKFVGDNKFIRLMYKIIIFIVPIIFMIITFFLLYYFSQNKADRHKVSLLYVLIGSIATTLLWILVTNGFGFYVANFASYDKTYGSIGGVIVLLTWLYLSSAILIVGAVFASSLQNYKDSKDINKTIYKNIKSNKKG